MKKSDKIRVYFLLAFLCVCLLVVGCASVPAKKYTITFDTGVEELTVETITAKAGTSISAPEEPERAGYRFDGWLLDGAVFVFDKMPKKDISLTAAWTKLYTLIFDTDTEDIVVPAAEYAEGEEVKKPADPKRFGFKFLGWFLDDTPYEFGTMPSEDVTVVAKWLELSNLPAMFIDLSDADGNTIPLADVTKEEYVDSVITLTNTEEQYELNSIKSYFKGRGNDSWNSYAKKGYKIKFDKKQSVFGREKNKHWVLLACAQFNDVTMCRNYLALNMAGEFFDGIEYTTPAYWVDIYVNGEYRGVYLLCEQVRVDKGRVEIESEYGLDNTGYLVEYSVHTIGEENVDYFCVDDIKFGFIIHSPDPEDYAMGGGITKERYMQQVAYIKDYVSRVYHAAIDGDYQTFSELADTDSFVDMYILHEFFKNVDTDVGSFYLYKKPGGKLYAGPVWDFDGTTNTALHRGDRTPQGIYAATAGENGYSNENSLFVRLYQIDGFQTDLRARWKELSPSISAFIEDTLNDEFCETYRTAMGRNFSFWKSKKQEKAEVDWIEDIYELKQWLLDRIEWLDDEWV